MAWRQRSANFRRKEGLLPGWRGFQPPRRCRWFMPTGNLASHKWRRLALLWPDVLYKWTWPNTKRLMAEDEGRGVEGQKSCHTGEVHRILPDFSLLLVVRRGYIFGERVKKLRRWRAFPSPNFPLNLNPAQTKLQKMSTNLLVLKKAVWIVDFFNLYMLLPL